MFGANKSQKPRRPAVINRAEAPKPGVCLCVPSSLPTLSYLPTRSAMSDQLIGAFITLIATNDVRYDGVLFSVNTAESKIVLRDGKHSVWMVCRSTCF